jgi:hypothetical protein
MSSLRHYLFAPLGLLALGGCYQPSVPPRPSNNCQMQLVPSKYAVVVPDRLTLTLYRLPYGETNCKSPQSVVFSVNDVPLGEDTTEPFIFVWDVKQGEPSVPTAGRRDVELRAVASYPGDSMQKTMIFGPTLVRLQVLLDSNVLVQP